MVGPGLKILVVSSYYHPAFIYGGPVPALHHLNQALLKAGHNLRVYTTNANGTGDLSVPLKVPVDVDGLPVNYFPRWWFGRRQKPFTRFFSPAMGCQLRQIGPGDFDLILIHAVWGDPGRMAAAAARRTGIPYICYTHGGFEPWASTAPSDASPGGWNCLPRSRRPLGRSWRGFFPHWRRGPSCFF